MDFFRKGLEEDESQQPQSHDASETEPSEKEDVDNDVTMLFHVKPVGRGRMAGAADSVEHKRFVRYLQSFLEVQFSYIWIVT